MGSGPQHGLWSSVSREGLLAPGLRLERCAEAGKLTISLDPPQPRFHVDDTEEALVRAEPPPHQLPDEGGLPVGGSRGITKLGESRKA